MHPRSKTEPAVTSIKMAEFFNFGGLANYDSQPKAGFKAFEIAPVIERIVTTSADRPKMVCLSLKMLKITQGLNLYSNNLYEFYKVVRIIYLYSFVNCCQRVFFIQERFQNTFPSLTYGVFPFMFTCLLYCIVVNSSGMWVLIDPLDLSLLWLVEVFPGSCILHNIDCRMLKFDKYDCSNPKRPS